MAPQQTKTQEEHNNMNYILRRNNRKIRGKEFETYEEARRYARREIRAKYRGHTLAWPSRNPPSITEYGYEIVRVGS